MSIEAHGIRKKFGTYTALDGVDLNVPQGKLVALLGPSGSGKTTLLRIIAGLEFPDPGSGRVLFHGDDVTEVPAGKRRVGFVFQHYALFRHMSVFDNVAFGLKVRRRRDRPSSESIGERVHRLLELVQLDGLAARFPSQLSGGERQRVALARALAVEPKVLLLDEPFGALDARVRKDLRRWLRRFHDEIQLTTIFVTHDQEEALEIADEVVIMNKAHVEQVGTPQQVYDKPASPFVYQFLGNATEGQIYVRPHDIELTPHDAGGEGYSAVVRHIHAAGPHAKILLEQVQNREPVEVEISRAELADLNLRVSDLVRMRLRQTHSFDEDYAI
jgi:sulfate transport system ATP-binding protein